MPRKSSPYANLPSLTHKDGSRQRRFKQQLKNNIYRKNNDKIDDKHLFEAFNSQHSHCSRNKHKGGNDYSENVHQHTKENRQSHKNIHLNICPR